MYIYNYLIKSAYTWVGIMRSMLECDARKGNQVAEVLTWQK